MRQCVDDHRPFSAAFRLSLRCLLRARAARSWGHSADFKEWAYHLRTDVRWDDGKPVIPAEILSLRSLERREFVQMCAGSLALAAVGCGRGEDRASVDKAKVTVLYIGDERIFFQDHWGMEATYLMFLPLATLGGDEDGKPRPVLAERWEHSENYREWTFSLRRDVKWHDGTRVTARDVKFTMDLRNHPALLGKLAERYSVEFVDDFKITVTYKEPTDGPDRWSVYYPEHLLGHLDPKEFWTWDFWTHPVGNGPYRYVRHVPKTMVEVAANPDYYRGKPRIETVVLKFAREASVTELLSGNVDALTYASRDVLLNLAGNDRFRSYHWWGDWIDAVYWNHRNPLFRRPEIRRAMTMAINRRELAGVLNYPEGVPITDAITTSNQFRQRLYPDPLPYDPERARELLEGEGWQDTDGAGPRKRDGKEFRFTAITVSETENIATYVQDQFRRIGIRMELQVVDTSVVRQRLRSGEFDAVIHRFSNSTTQPNFGHVKMLGEGSPLGYANPEMIRLLNLAKDAIDLDDRDRIYQEIMPIFMADLPVTFLLPQVQTHIAHRRIKGLKSVYRADPVWFMEELWIDDED